MNKKTLFLLYMLAQSFQSMFAGHHAPSGAPKSASPAAVHSQPVYNVSPSSKPLLSPSLQKPAIAPKPLMVGGKKVEGDVLVKNNRPPVAPRPLVPANQSNFTRNLVKQGEKTNKNTVGFGGKPEPVIMEVKPIPKDLNAALFPRQRANAIRRRSLPETPGKSPALQVQRPQSIGDVPIKKNPPATLPKPAKQAEKPNKNNAGFGGNVEPKDMDIKPIITQKNTQPLSPVLKASVIGKEFGKFDINFKITEKLTSLDGVKKSTVKVIYDMNNLLQKDSLQPAELGNLLKILDATASKVDDFIMKNQGEARLKAIVYKEQLLLNRENIIMAKDIVAAKQSSTNQPANLDFSGLKLKKNKKKAIVQDAIVPKKYGVGIESMADLFFDTANKSEVKSIQPYKDVIALKLDMRNLRNFEGGVYSPLLFDRFLENIGQKIQKSSSVLKAEYKEFSANIASMREKNKNPEAYVKNQFKMLSDKSSSPELQGIAHTNLQLILTDPKMGPEIKKHISQKLASMPTPLTNSTSTVAVETAGKKMPPAVAPKPFSRRNSSIDSGINLGESNA